jgi:hypothetical protein
MTGNDKKLFKIYEKFKINNQFINIFYFIINFSYFRKLRTKAICWTQWRSRNN